LPSYYFPCLGISGPEAETVPRDGVILRRRLFEPSSFDFATLGGFHGLQFKWQMLDLFVSQCGVEIEITDVPDFAAAQERIRLLQAMLYVHWVTPFIVPFGLTHGMRDYSGINSRDSDALREKLPPELQVGFTSADGHIEGWLHEPALECVSIPSKGSVTAETFAAAAASADQWLVLEREFAPLSAARRALQAAATMQDVPSSLLHVWQGLEALFPNVSSELSFRLALLIAQLCAPVRNDRMKTYRVAKGSYGQPSRVAHGDGSKVDFQAWLDAWDLLVLCLSACLERRGLPTEDALTSELLA
jgi:hypothetical protein